MMISRLAMIIVVLAIALGCQFSMFPNEIVSIDPPPTAIDFSQIEMRRTSDNWFVIGSADAPITVVVFGDFMCSHCQNYNPTVNDFIAEFVVTGKARLEYRIISILGETSTAYAKLAECAAINSRDDSYFWLATNLLFDYGRQGLSSSEAQSQLASALDLSNVGLTECSLTVSGYEANRGFSYRADITGTPAVRILLGTFAETDGETPKPISPDEASGGVDIAILRATIEALRPQND